MKKQIGFFVLALLILAVGVSAHDVADGAAFLAAQQNADGGFPQLKTGGASYPLNSGIIGTALLKANNQLYLPDAKEAADYIMTKCLTPKTASCVNAEDVIFLMNYWKSSCGGTNCPEQVYKTRAKEVMNLVFAQNVNTFLLTGTDAQIAASADWLRAADSTGGSTTERTWVRNGANRIAAANPNTPLSLGRSILVLSEYNPLGYKTQILAFIAELVGLQNADGGFGIMHDTAVACKGLKKAEMTSLKFYIPAANKKGLTTANWVANHQAADHSYATQNLHSAEALHCLAATSYK